MPEPVSVIAFLYEFFPERARGLGAFLKHANAEEQKVEDWRERQLINFIESLILSATDLERAFVEKRITKLAWAARNVLELSIWIDYGNLSAANAKRFRDDAARDLYGLSQAIQSLHVSETTLEQPDLKKAQQQLAAFAQSWGISSLEDDFKKVSAAARELGREKTFVALNKLFSKLAHPTAWAVNSVRSIEADAGLRQMFLCDGIEMATDSLTSIRTFILTIFLPLASASSPREPDQGVGRWRFLASIFSASFSMRLRTFSTSSADGRISKYFL